jgi:hypothetical protein
MIDPWCMLCLCLNLWLSHPPTEQGYGGQQTQTCVLLYVVYTQKQGYMKGINPIYEIQKQDTLQYYWPNFEFTGPRKRTCVIIQGVINVVSCCGRRKQFPRGPPTTSSNRRQSLQDLAITSAPPKLYKFSTILVEHSKLWVSNVHNCTCIALRIIYDLQIVSNYLRSWILGVGYLCMLKHETNSFKFTKVSHPCNFIIVNVSVLPTDTSGTRNHLTIHHA